MEDFLRSIKLIDEMSTTFKMTRTEFVSALRDDVEESDIKGVFSGMFEYFSSDKRVYKGELSSRGFHIRHKKRRGDINAKGTFRTSGDDLIVNTTISAFIGNRFLAMSLTSIAYFVFIFYQFNVFDSFLNLSEIPVVFLLFIIAFPFVSYYNLKKGVVDMKKDLKNKFYSITTKINHSR